jgi:hypothetical protein
VKYVTSFILRGFRGFFYISPSELTQCYKWEQTGLTEHLNNAGQARNQRIISHHMSKSHIVFGVLGVFAAVAAAQPVRGSMESAKTEATAPVHDVDLEQRKASLRASLKSQTDGAGKREAATISLHELSARERADLRQQLRQQ